MPPYRICFDIFPLLENFPGVLVFSYDSSLDICFNWLPLEEGMSLENGYSLRNFLWIKGPGGVISLHFLNCSSIQFLYTVFLYTDLLFNFYFILLSAQSSFTYTHTGFGPSLLLIWIVEVIFNRFFSLGLSSITHATLGFVFLCLKHYLILTQSSIKTFCLLIVHRIKSMPFQFQLQLLLFNYVPVIGKQKQNKRKKVDTVSALVELVVYHHTIR